MPLGGIFLNKELTSATTTLFTFPGINVRYRTNIQLVNVGTITSVVTFALLDDPTKAIPNPLDDEDYVLRVEHIPPRIAKRLVRIPFVGGNRIVSFLRPASEGRPVLNIQAVVEL